MDLGLVALVLGFGAVAVAGAASGVARFDRFLRLAGAPSPSPWAAGGQEPDVPPFSMERWARLRSDAGTTDVRPVIEVVDPAAAGIIELERLHDVPVERVPFD